MRFLDNVIDISRFPLPAQEKEAKQKRRIGLGVTGLADALIFCRTRYGSAQSLARIERWLKILRDNAYAASAELAAEKGAFPLFDRDAYLARPNIAALPEDIRAALEEFEERLRTQGGYDSRMGRRLAAVCRDIGLTAISESRWNDAELAFNGPAPAEILAAWRRRFARLPVMKAYFGAERFDQIAGAFLESISRPDHRSTAAVVMVQAERPS